MTKSLCSLDLVLKCAPVPRASFCGLLVAEQLLAEVSQSYRDSGSYFFLYFFVLCFPGYALRCNQCFSEKSWDECNNTTGQANCKDGEDRCGKGEVKSEISGKTVEIFEKGCTTSSRCSQLLKICKSTYPSIKITKCEVDCCKGDLCNGA